MNFIKLHPSKGNKTYSPKNKGKYTGTYPIWVRSGLEEKFCQILDYNNNVIEWSSEPMEIPYMFQNKKKKYFPDFFVKVALPGGTSEKWLVEIKPNSQSMQPSRSVNKSRKTVLTEQFTWEKNKAKWKAANLLCSKLGWQFKIIGEKQLFKKI